MTDKKEDEGFVYGFEVLEKKQNRTKLGLDQNGTQT